MIEENRVPVAYWELYEGKTEVKNFAWFKFARTTQHTVCIVIFTLLGDFSPYS
jgi:hypothetical protein